jgi:glycosyltransferase involved in cell wall biosynthesis
MKVDIRFPYPYLVNVMDEYFKVPSKSRKKKGARENRRKIRSSKTGTKRKLSILIATFWDYPHTGGLSNYIKTLSEGLRKLGHRVDIVSPNQFPVSEVERMREESVPKLRSFFQKRYGSSNNMILKNQRHLYVYEQMLLKYADLKKYDIFHAQDLFTANILGRINEYYGKPLFFTNHGMFTFNRVKFDIFKKGSLEEAYYTALEEKAISVSDHLVILSDVFRQPLTQLGAKKGDMTTVLTGIDYPTIKKTKNKKVVITCVARLGPRKGQNVLLDAIAQLPKSYRDNMQVLIAGDGEMREALEKQVKHLSLSMVEFLGTRDDVPHILSQTDIFVLPTLNDSLPISIIEAMHSGACVISTFSGGIPELIKHSQTGILVDAGDVRKLASALKFAMDNDEAREKLGRNAKKFAKERLTREAMINKIESIYRKYLSEG